MGIICFAEGVGVGGRGKLRGCNSSIIIAMSFLVKLCFVTVCCHMKHSILQHVFFFQ